MDYDKLRKILLKSYTSIFVITAILLLMGVALIAYAFIDEKGSMVGKLIFGLIFFGLGAVVVVRKTGDYQKIVKGEFPILKAIKLGDKEFLLWAYHQQIDTTAGHGGQKVGSTYNVVFYDRDGKNETLVLRKTPPEEVLSYLSEVFPAARIGYTEEIKAEVSQLLGKKL